MPKQTDTTIEVEPLRTTSIRDSALTRAQCCAAYKGQNVADYVTEAVNGSAKEDVKRHGIKLPPKVAFPA